MAAVDGDDQQVGERGTEHASRCRGDGQRGVGSVGQGAHRALTADLEADGQEEDDHEEVLDQGREVVDDRRGTLGIETAALTKRT